jgi:hypothetical protein
MFVHPNADTRIDPADLPGVTSETSRYAPIISGEYLAERFSQYRVSWTDVPAGPQAMDARNGRHVPT